MADDMDAPKPHLYDAVTHPDKSGRGLVIGLVVFCALLLFGSIYFVVNRMPKMLSDSIIEARRVDITSSTMKAPLVFTAPVHREALAKLVDQHDFRFSPGDTWRTYRGEVNREGKEIFVFEIVTSNRNTPVEIIGGDMLLTGRFAFKAAHKTDLGPEVANIAKLKK
jgi:hypothetical protein